MSAVEPSLGKRIRISPALVEPRSPKAVPARDSLLLSPKRLPAMTQLGAAGFGQGAERLRFPIAAGRIQRPHLPEQTLHRDRLLDWLDAHIDRRLICVIAEAGYGKSTLLADFSRRTRVRTVWYRAAEDHRDAVTVVRYLVAAARLVEPEFGPQTSHLLDGDGSLIPTDEGTISSLVSELDGLVAQPTALIVDDYHEIDDVPEIRDLFIRILENAPQHFSLVIASRREPGFPVARLRSLGEHADLSRRDLRFDHAETERFFRESAGLPLERSVLDDVERRTEGWAASLSLVATNLRGRSDAEIRSFVRRLSGAHGALFDFLAEEVVGDLDDDFQSFLMRASILQSVDADLAAVAAGRARADVDQLISRAMRLGLLAPSADDPERPTGAFHPLVRDFLDARLRRSLADAEIAALHVAVAEAARPRSWQIAAHHFEAAGDLDRMREVIRGAAALVMGAGQFAIAERFLRHLEGDLDPLFDVIRARSLFQHGSIPEAHFFATRALAASGPSVSSSAGELAASNLMAIEYMLFNVERAEELARTLETAAQSDELAAIARAMTKLIRCTRDEPIDPFRAELEQLATRQELAGHSHYAGISYLNLALLDRTCCDALACLDHSARSIDALSREGESLELSVVRLVHAWALAFAGSTQAALALIEDVLRNHKGFGSTELLAEAADVMGTLIDPDAAAEILDRLATRHEGQTGELASLMTSVAEDALRRRDYVAAAAALATSEAGGATGETGHAVRVLSLRAHSLLHAGDADRREETANAAIALARHQGANYWLEYALLVRSTLNDVSFAQHVRSLMQRNPTFGSVCAELIAERLGVLDEATWGAVEAQIRERPLRWRRSLRAAVASAGSETQVRAALALDEIGDRGDVQLLRRLAKQPALKKRYSQLGRRLATRLAAPAFIEDQGRVEILVGATCVPETAVRRKALALLCFLLTRPDLAATKDQVLDALWPDADPDDSVNSLNQTLFYLRRFFEPAYDEDTSARYVINDSQLIWLNCDLIDSRSRRCAEIIRRIGTVPGAGDVAELREAYRGRFALDFAYEDWATDFREILHASYLDVMDKAVRHDTQIGQFERALDNARAVLQVDPRSVDAELELIRLYKRTGAHRAAMEQYAHYAALVRSELGIEPSPLEDL